MRLGSPDFDVAVIGGGITGAFSAYFLARLGVRPILIERERIAAQASGNNPGGLNPLHGAGIPGPMEPLALESFRLHRENGPAIRELSGSESSPQLVTKVHLAMDDEDVDHLHDVKQRHDSTPGFSARWLQATELSAIHPGLSPRIIRALCTEGNGKVDPGSYTRAVAKAAEKLGAGLHHGEVRGLRHSSGQVTHVLLESGPLSCDAVVIATGAWSQEPARWLDTPIPVVPIKGELLLVDSDGRGVDCDLAWREAAVYRRGNGDVWLGGNEERAGFDTTPTRAMRESIRNRVARVFPAMKEAVVRRHIAGLRPSTPDGIPIVGLAPGWENVCVATGAGRKGMLLGAGLGKAAAELMATGGTRLPIDACSPERWIAAAR